MPCSRVLLQSPHQTPKYSDNSDNNTSFCSAKAATRLFRKRAARRNKLQSDAPSEYHEVSSPFFWIWAYSSEGCFFNAEKYIHEAKKHTYGKIDGHLIKFRTHRRYVEMQNKFNVQSSVWSYSNIISKSVSIEIRVVDNYMNIIGNHIQLRAY